MIVGLGNPGAKYAQNRHNVGFMVADLLTSQVGAAVGGDPSKAWKRNSRVRAHVCQGRIPPTGVSSSTVLLAKPMTYMTLSGQVAGPLAVYYKIPNERVIAIHDELDLPYGVVRLKSGGGEGGHNGLKSLTQALGGRDYVRVRVGIGRPPGRMDAASYVLRDFSRDEHAQLPLVVDLAADAAVEVVTSGLSHAQNKFHALS